MEGEKQPLNEVKVLLVGDGGAGKTSLVKQVLGEKFDKNEQQKGGYISTIRKTMGDINDSFEKLNATVLVPLPLTYRIIFY